MNPAALRRPVGSPTTSHGRWRHQGQHPRRGVSEIIATIYVVAITVVLAGVLFVEVSSMSLARPSAPYELEMVFSTQANVSKTYFDFGTLVPTSGLTTSVFGLRVTTPEGGTLDVAALAPATCTYGAVNPSPETCPGSPGSWYGILMSGGSSGVTAMYSGAGWTYSSGTTDITLNPACSLVIVTSLPVSGTGDRISVFGTSWSSVSGSASL